VLAQLLGASGAAAVLRGLFGTAGHLGATLPEPGFTSGQAFGMEVLLTFGLVSVILGVPSAAQNVGQFAAIGVGSYIVLAGLWSSPVSGASMNPARSAGPALVAGDLHQLWIYLIASPVGAIAAVGAAWILRGTGGDRTARAAAEGRLDWRVDGTVAARHAHFRARVLPQARGRVRPWWGCPAAVGPGMVRRRGGVRGRRCS